MIFLNLNIGPGIIESDSSIYIVISLLIVFMLLVLYNFISKNQPTNIDNEDLDFPIYRDLDILLQEKPIHNNSQEFLPEIPLKTNTSLFTKIIVIIISILLIFNYLNSILQYY